MLVQLNNPTRSILTCSIVALLMDLAVHGAPTTTAALLSEVATTAFNLIYARASHNTQYGIGERPESAATAWGRHCAGTSVAMAAKKGPEYFEKAWQLHDKAQIEQNPTKRNELIAEAHLNATLALVALHIEAGLDEKQSRHWFNRGFRKFEP